MNTQLLLTFSDKREYKDCISNIRRYFTIIDNRVFVLEDVLNPESVYITYNIDAFNYNDKPQKTILVHRKKHTNTIYTVNAINKIIINEIGYLNSNYKINWNNYKNSLTLVRNNNLIVRNTKLYEIIDF